MYLLGFGARHGHRVALKRVVRHKKAVQVRLGIPGYAVRRNEAAAIIILGWQVRAAHNFVLVDGGAVHTAARAGLALKNGAAQFPLAALAVAVVVVSTVHDVFFQQSRFFGFCFSMTEHRMGMTILGSTKS